MAHEISVTEDGVEEAAYANDPAWHGLGTVVRGATDSKTMITAAHLDWRVDLVPLKTECGLAVPDKFATVRNEPRAILGVVGDRYRPVQNSEAFEFLDNLTMDGVMRYESAGALYGGRVVWVLARMPSVDVAADGDKMLRFVLFKTSHDGRSKVTAIPTSVRVVCANTLAVAMSGHSGEGFVHSGDVKKKLEQARRYVSQFDRAFDLFRDKAQVLATRRYTTSQAVDYLEKLFPTPDEDGAALNARQRRVAAIRGALVNRSNTLESVCGTWWSLLNAVTETVDHDDKVRKTREQREHKFLSVVEGVGADLKQRALDVAVQMSA